MRDIRSKIETQRTAVAQAIVRAQPGSLTRLLSNDLPKPDVIPTCRAAGLLAAKRTSDLIPDCHPLSIDAAAIDFDVQTDHVRITASITSIGRTGVEMEALTAASIAALTLYDMLKPVDTTLEITSTKLLEKHGGKGEHRSPPKHLRVAVLVTSDGTFEGNRQDRSGALLVEAMKSYGLEPKLHILPDDEETIKDLLLQLCGDSFDLVLTTGGTGLGPRDRTVEATRRVLEREAPGIAEAARVFGQARTPYAMLSRGLAGVRGKTLILNLPGSSNGVKEGLAALFPAIFHAFPMMRGGGHE